MNNNKLLDICSDYLISAFVQMLHVRLAGLLNGRLSHDTLQRFLNGRMPKGADLRRLMKLYIRHIRNECAHRPRQLIL